MKYEDEYDYDDDEDYEVGPASMRNFTLNVIPRFMAIGCTAIQTAAGSTSLGFSILVWKVSMTVSFQTYR